MRDGKKFYSLNYIDLEDGEKKNRNCSTRKSIGLAKSIREMEKTKRIP